MLSTRGEKSTRSSATSRYIGSSAAMHSSIVRSRAISSLLRTSTRNRGQSPISVHHFKQACGAHAAPDAHGDDHVFRAPAPAFDERVADEARAGHAVGMADGDGAAVDVQALVRDVQAVAAVDHLHCERFVELPEVDV